MNKANQTDEIITPVINRIQTLALFAAGGFCMFIMIMFSFHFIQPELDLMTQFGSEYVVGRLGWIMNLAFFFFAGGLFLLAVTFKSGLEHATRSKAGEILLYLSSIGILGSGIFNADLQAAERTTMGILHDLSGFLAFLSLIPAMFVLSRRLKQSGKLRGGYKALSYLFWLVLILFFAFMFYFGPNDMAGLGQRLFLASVFSWLILAAMGFKTGAFMNT